MGNDPPMTDPLPPEAPSPVVRIWSPLAVAVYGLLMTFPAAVVLSVKNWHALRLRGRILPHVAGAAVLAVLLVGILTFGPPRVRRIFSLATTVMAFVYLKEKLNSDLREFRAAHPDVRVEMRPWYSAFGWALLGFFFLMVIVMTASLFVTVLKALVQG